MSKTTDVLVASGSTHTLVDRLRLDGEEGCHTLSVESAVPIFTLALQCSLPLQLLDVPSNVAILSRSPPDEKAGSLTLATYRCAPQAPHDPGALPHVQPHACCCCCCSNTQHRRHAQP
jgi:hypothetical protein